MLRSTHASPAAALWGCAALAETTRHLLMARGERCSGAEQLSEGDALALVAAACAALRAWPNNEGVAEHGCRAVAHVAALGCGASSVVSPPPAAPDTGTGGGTVALLCDVLAAHSATDAIVLEALGALANILCFAAKAHRLLRVPAADVAAAISSAVVVLSSAPGDAAAEERACRACRALRAAAEVSLLRGADCTATDVLPAVVALCARLSLRPGSLSQAESASALAYFLSTTDVPPFSLPGCRAAALRCGLPAALAGVLRWKGPPFVTASCAASAATAVALLASPPPCADLEEAAAAAACAAQLLSAGAAAGLSRVLRAASSAAPLRAHATAAAAAAALGVLCGAAGGAGAGAVADAGGAAALLAALSAFGGTSPILPLHADADADGDAGAAAACAAALALSRLVSTPSGASSAAAPASDAVETLTAFLLRYLPPPNARGEERLAGGAAIAAARLHAVASMRVLAHTRPDALNPRNAPSAVASLLHVLTTGVSVEQSTDCSACCGALAEVLHALPPATSAAALPDESIAAAVDTLTDALRRLLPSSSPRNNLLTVARGAADGTSAVAALLSARPTCAARFATAGAAPLLLRVLEASATSGVSKTTDCSTDCSTNLLEDAALAASSAAWSLARLLEATVAPGCDTGVTPSQLFDACLPCCERFAASRDNAPLASCLALLAACVARSPELARCAWGRGACRAAASAVLRSHHSAATHPHAGADAPSSSAAASPRSLSDASALEPLRAAACGLIARCCGCDSRTGFLLHEISSSDAELCASAAAVAASFSDPSIDASCAASFVVLSRLCVRSASCADAAASRGALEAAVAALEAGGGGGSDVSPTAAAAAEAAACALPAVARLWAADDETTAGASSSAPHDARLTPPSLRLRRLVECGAAEAAVGALLAPPCGTLHAASASLLRSLLRLDTRGGGALDDDDADGAVDCEWTSAWERADSCGAVEALVSILLSPSCSDDVLLAASAASALAALCDPSAVTRARAVGAGGIEACVALLLHIPGHASPHNREDTADAVVAVCAAVASMCVEPGAAKRATDAGGVEAAAAAAAVLGGLPPHQLAAAPLPELGAPDVSAVSAACLRVIAFISAPRDESLPPL